MFALDDTTARRSPACSAACRYRREPSKTCTPSVRIRRCTASFFRLPRPFTVIAVGGSSSVPSGSVIPREVRKSRTPSTRGLPST